MQLIKVLGLDAKGTSFAVRSFTAKVVLFWLADLQTGSGTRHLLCGGERFLSLPSQLRRDERSDHSANTTQTAEMIQEEARPMLMKTLEQVFAVVVTAGLVAGNFLMFTPWRNGEDPRQRQPESLMPKNESVFSDRPKACATQSSQRLDS